MYSCPFYKVSEMTAREYFSEHSDLLDTLPASVRLDILSDDNYIVRVSSRGHVEVGYRTDDWHIS